MKRGEGWAQGGEGGRARKKERERVFACIRVCGSECVGCKGDG